MTSQRISYILCLILFFFSSCTVYCQFSFNQYSIPTGSWADVVGIGDMNNDGLKDVVLATSSFFDPVNDLKIFVYLQGKQGNLMSPVKYSYSNGYGRISSMKIADVNNDKLNDVVVSFGSSIGILIQNSFGTLNPVEIINTGWVYSMDVGDLNHDGLKDIVVAKDNKTASVYYQKISGGFSSQDFSLPFSSTHQVQIADINNDSRDDIIFLAFTIKEGQIYIYPQDNSGTFGNYTIYKTKVWSDIDAIGVGDISNDRLNDIVELASGNMPNSQVILAYQDTLTHELKPPVYLSSYDIPDAVRIANLNCDERNEIVVINGGFQAITIYEQDQAGKYNAYSRISIPYASSYAHDGLSIGDINNDGKQDIVIADYNHGLVVLTNTTGQYGAIPKPVISGERLICDDNSISTYKIKHEPGNKIVWSIGAVEAGKVLSSDNDSCTIAWNNTWKGTAAVYANAYGQCGFNNDSLFITLGHLPKLDLGKDTAICVNKSLTLVANDGFTSYIWQDGSTGKQFTVTKTGTYSIEAGNICGTRKDTIRVESVPLPQIQARDTFLCTGNPIQVDVTLAGRYTYFWQDNSVNPVYTISKPGTYSVAIKDDHLCKSSKSFTVREKFPPKLQLPKDTSFCDQVYLLLNVYNPGSSYQWQDGCSSSNYLIQKEGTYSVKITNECSTLEKEINVIVKNCQTYLDVPTAFSPNNDGLNDILYGVGTNVKDIRFIIFNRWGQKIFESKSLDAGWDGTFQGQKLEPGVFIFYISGISTMTGQTVEKHGNVTLIR